MAISNGRYGEFVEIVKEGEPCPRCYAKRLKHPGVLRIAWRNMQEEGDGVTIPPRGMICYECTHCIHYDQEPRQFVRKDVKLKPKV